MLLVGLQEENIFQKKDGNKIILVVEDEDLDFDDGGVGEGSTANIGIGRDDKSCGVDFQADASNYSKVVVLIFMLILVVLGKVWVLVLVLVLVYDLQSFSQSLGSNCSFKPFICKISCICFNEHLGMRLRPYFLKISFFFLKFFLYIFTF